MKRILAALMLLVTIAVPGAMAHEMNWDNLMLASAKLNPHFDYEANVDAYMSIYMPDTWNRVKNDEFELSGKRAEVVKIMKERIAEFSLDEDFSFLVALKFQDYDFEKEAFPVTKMEPDAYFGHQKGRPGTFPFEYRVFFSNPHFFQDIQMPKDEAKEFLQSRKTTDGKVNRLIVAEIRFRATRIKDTPDKLEAEIVGVTTYRDKERTKILQQY